MKNTKLILFILMYIIMFPLIFIYSLSIGTINECINVWKIMKNIL